jgi:hypothetical protein
MIAASLSEKMGLQRIDVLRSNNGTIKMIRRDL